jgi:hypothetical protein
VALGAVLPEVLEVPILGGMAGGTVQHRFESGDVRVTGDRPPGVFLPVDPGNELLPYTCALAARAVLVSGLPQVVPSKRAGMVMVRA